MLDSFVHLCGNFLNWGEHSDLSPSLKQHTQQVMYSGFHQQCRKVFVLLLSEAAQCGIFAGFDFWHTLFYWAELSLKNAIFAKFAFLIE